MFLRKVAALWKLLSRGSLLFFVRPALLPHFRLILCYLYIRPDKYFCTSALALTWVELVCNSCV